MDLKTYFQDHTQNSLAAALGVTPGAVSQWRRPDVKVTAERCIDIEKATGGKVRCEDLRPDIDWQYIRANTQATEA